MTEQGTTGTALGAVLVGLERIAVRVEARVSPGSGVEILGFPDVAAREARIRLRSALHAWLPKDARVEIGATLPIGAGAGSLDLALAAAVLRALGHSPRLADGAELGADAVFVGEIGLDGRTRSTRGAAALVDGSAVHVVPHADAVGIGSVLSEAHSVYAVGEVSDLLAIEQRVRPWSWDSLNVAPEPDGRAELRPSHRAILDRCLAGRRRVLLVGPPGSGKTMIARRVASCAPSMSREEKIAVARIYSAAGLLTGADAMRTTLRRPFRAPHHTVSEGGLLGGGERIRPGEITLAHHGVLLLDEILEFRGSMLDALARALKDGEAVHVRGWRMPERADGEERRMFRLPARPFAVLAAANPCPCGRGERTCSCSADAKRRHEERLASVAYRLGLERIDVPAVDLHELAGGASP